MAGFARGFSLDGRGVLQCEPFTQWPWLDHGFSTRHSAGWMEGTQLASVQQVHSDLVIAAAGPGIQGEADALIANKPGLHLGIRTADCLPIILVDPVNRAVAAIHSGWRGTASGIAIKAASKLRDQYGSNPSDLHAAIGPGIGPCCYEVGPEVAARFGTDGRAHVDLAGEVGRQLQALGIPAAQVHCAALCTFCHGDLFWSYRRECEEAGRMWSGAAILQNRQA